MDERLIEMYKRIKEVYVESVSTLMDVQRESLTERRAAAHADNAFAANECNKLVEDLGKDLRKLLSLSEKMANLLTIQAGNMGPIRTEYVTASLRQKMAVSVPPRDSAEYSELCQFLGIPCNEHIRVHYPTLRDTVTKAIEEGKTLPPWCSELQPEFHLTLRKRKEVDGGAELSNEKQLELDLEF